MVGILLSAGLAGAFIGIFHANSIGLTGPGFGLEAMALTGRRALRAYFSGQNIALGLVAVPLLAVVSFGIASVARHPVDGFLGLAVDLAGIGAGLAVSNILTAGLAYPVEKRAGNPSPRPADGYAGYPALGALLCLASVGVAVAPVVLVSVFTESDPAAIRLPLIVLVAAGYGFGLTWAGMRFAAAMAAQKLPELCQVALRSRL
jgi:ABC-2 type transport system permease protein